jgi:hypothetical protein
MPDSFCSLFIGRLKFPDGKTQSEAQKYALYYQPSFQSLRKAVVGGKEQQLELWVGGVQLLTSRVMVLRSEELAVHPKKLGYFSEIFHTTSRGCCVHCLGKNSVEKVGGGGMMVTVHAYRILSIKSIFQISDFLRSVRIYNVNKTHPAQHCFILYLN